MINNKYVSYSTAMMVIYSFEREESGSADSVQRRPRGHF